MNFIEGIKVWIMVSLVFLAAGVILPSLAIGLLVFLTKILTVAGAFDIILASFLVGLLVAITFSKSGRPKA